MKHRKSLWQLVPLRPVGMRHAKSVKASFPTLSVGKEAFTDF